jgi:hypothetical protein
MNRRSFVKRLLLGADWKRPVEFCTLSGKPK